MSGWAVFPYQHISPLWREMQLSILCTGSPGWGSGPRTHWELSSLPEHISELALPPALPSCTPSSQSHRNLSPGPAGDAQGPLGLLFPAHSSILHNSYSWNSLWHCSHQNTLKQAAIKRSNSFKKCSSTNFQTNFKDNKSKWHSV